MEQPQKKYKLIAIVTCIAAITIPLICSKIQNNYFKKKLLQNSVFTIGTVTKYKKEGNKIVPKFEYYFMLDGKYYYSSNGSSCKSSDYINLKQKAIGRSFPVLVNRKFPEEYNTILIVPEDFNEYANIPFPDSLNWVLDYIER